MVLRVPEGCEYYAADASNPEMEAQIRQLAFRYGESYASYVATETGWETFWSPGRTGAVRFARWCGYYATTGCGLLASPEDQEQLLQHFTQFLQLNGLSMMFMNMGRDQLAPFRKQGFQITKVGEEPVVRLDSTTWQGREFEWVRRQENFCLRQVLELVEVNTDPADPHYAQVIAPELIKISREHLTGTVHGHEMKCFVGRFTPFDMGHKRLFIARGESRIEAFIVCNPCLEGTMWAIEMYRRREDALRGVIPFAVVQTMRQLQQQGIPYCSLSLVPMLRCEIVHKGDSWLVRSTYYLWWRYGNSLFDVQGMYHFKSRFRPEYREIYVVAWKKASVLSLIGMGRLWGVIKVNPFRMLAKWWQQTGKSKTRQNLAVPAIRPDRVLRRLHRPMSKSVVITETFGESYRPENVDKVAGELVPPSRESIQAP